MEKQQTQRDMIEGVFNAFFQEWEKEREGIEANLQKCRDTISKTERQVIQLENEYDDLLERANADKATKIKFTLITTRDILEKQRSEYEMLKDDFADHKKTLPAIVFDGLTEAYKTAQRQVNKQTDELIRYIEDYETAIKELVRFDARFSGVDGRKMHQFLELFIRIPEKHQR